MHSPEAAYPNASQPAISDHPPNGVDADVQSLGYVLELQKLLSFTHLPSPFMAITDLVYP
jgi:hypothetical protein